jgi:cell division protein FtsQ
MSDEKKRKKKVKKKVRKIYITTVAIILATVTLAFCLNYLINKTDVFNIIEFNIEGNNVYSFEYLVSRTGINLGDNLFSVNRKEIKKMLEKEVYIEDCKISYYIPNRINIKIIEREERYLITYNDNIIVTDKNAYVLDGNLQNNVLFPIESFAPVVYNIGEEIKIDGLYNFNKLNELLQHSDSLNDIDKIQKIYIHENNIISVDTQYGMEVKFELNDDEIYSYNFALEVIKLRLQNGHEVEGYILDYTKGENPVSSPK